MTMDREEIELDEGLSAAARTLHREWHSPALWPSIEKGLLAAPDAPRRSRGWVSWFATRWQPVAGSAVLALAVAAAAWLGSRPLTAPQPGTIDAQQRLLSEEALAAIELSEAQYIEAIDELARAAAPKLEMPDSQLLLNLRERLVAIDAAIEESRMEIDRNPFNAHLRRQLLWIYQEKRNTLEQVEEYEDNAL